MSLNFWPARPVIRPDKLYSEATVLDLFDMEPNQQHVLAEWRERGTGPAHTVLPNGTVRYFGSALIEITTPDEVA